MLSPKIPSRVFEKILLGAESFDGRLPRGSPLAPDYGSRIAQLTSEGARLGAESRAGGLGGSLGHGVGQTRGEDTGGGHCI